MFPRFDSNWTESTQWAESSERDGPAIAGSGVAAVNPPGGFVPHRGG
jgi:hypothetical protein